MNTILGLAIGLAALAAGAGADTGALPLERGVYVETSAACPGPVSSARSWFGGGYVIQAPHAHCDFKSVTRPGPADYVVTLQCYENGDRALPYEVVDKVRIIGPREYELQNQFGRFRSRWCRN